MWEITIQNPPVRQLLPLRHLVKTRGRLSPQVRPLFNRQRLEANPFLLRIHHSAPILSRPQRRRPPHQQHLIALL